MGELDSIPPLLDAAEPLLDGLPFGQRLDHQSIHAILHLLQGETEAAVSNLQVCVSLLQRPSQATLFCAAIQLLTAVLMLRVQKPDADDKQIWQPIAKFSKDFAKIYPMAVPAWYYAQALDAGLKGKQKQLVELLDAGLATAVKQDMPYETALLRSARLHYGLDTDPEPLEQLLQRMGVTRLIDPFAV